MAFVSKNDAKRRRSKTFTITLQGENGPEEFLAQRMSANDETAYSEAFSKTEKWLLRLMFLAAFVLRDPEDADKPLFDLDNAEDVETLGKWSPDDLLEVSNQYAQHVNPPRSNEELEEHAKNSETTEQDTSSSTSVENSEETTSIQTSSSTDSAQSN